MEDAKSLRAGTVFGLKISREKALRELHGEALAEFKATLGGKDSAALEAAMVAEWRRRNPKREGGK